MKKLSDYIASFERIKRECLAVLPYGSPAWPSFRSNPVTQSNFNNSRRDSTAKIQDIQRNYMKNLHISGVDPSKIDVVIKQPEHQFQLRKAYALNSVQQVEHYGVAGCNEMTQLVLVKIKKAFPELIVKFAVLKHYNHAFAVIQNPNDKDDKLVFDLFAHGFKQAVIYPIADLQENMSKLNLELISRHEITDLNKEYHEVWTKQGLASMDQYSIKLELASLELFRTDFFSKKYLKFGMFAIITLASVAIAYCASSEDNNFLTS